MKIYANDHAGAYPQDYQVLVDSGEVIPKSFRCVYADAIPDDLNACYKYITGQGEWVPDDNVIIYEISDCHGNDGGCVAFGDGHVEFLTHDEIARRVQQTREWLLYNAGPQP